MARTVTVIEKYNLRPSKKRKHLGVMSILKKDKFNEVLSDAGKRSRSPRLKGIE